MRNRALDIGLILLALFVTTLNSGFSKPLWIDEYLQFAIGGLAWSEALSVVWNSTGSGVNWGQTGTYLMWDWLMGRAFGANLWALRSPSIISGFMLLLCAVWFIRMKGLNRGWQYLVVVSLATQSTLMFYFGEARPYLPLAASVVAICAYLATPLDLRGDWRVRAIAVYGFIIGALFHPYWLPFALVMIAFSLWVAWRQKWVHGLREVLMFISVRMLMISTIAYLVLASLTWFRNPQSPRVDPWEYLGDIQGAFRTLVATHSQFVRIEGMPFDLSVGDVTSDFFLSYGLAGVLIICSFIGIGVSRHWRKSLVEPLVLGLLAIMTSVAVAALSVLNNYWVLQRQWLAGIALVVLAAVWGIGNLSRESSRSPGYASRIFIWTCCLIICARFVMVVVQTSGNLVRHSTILIADEVTPLSRCQTVTSALESGMPESAGNMNVATGGRIWPEHGLYYNIGERCPSS